LKSSIFDVEARAVVRHPFVIRNRKGCQRYRAYQGGDRSRSPRSMEKVSMFYLNTYTETVSANFIANLRPTEIMEHRSVVSLAKAR